MTLAFGVPTPAPDEATAGLGVDDGTSTNVVVDGIVGVGRSVGDAAGVGSIATGATAFGCGDGIDMVGEALADVAEAGSFAWSPPQPTSVAAQKHVKTIVARRRRFGLVTGPAPRSNCATGVGEILTPGRLTDAASRRHLARQLMMHGSCRSRV